MLKWHSRDNDDSDESTGNDQEKRHVLQIWNESIAENYKGSAQPRDRDKGNIAMPGLRDKVWMEDSVHLNDNI